MSDTAAEQPPNDPAPEGEMLAPETVGAAARSLAGMMDEAGFVVRPTDCHVLLAAWLDAAPAVVAARGPEGLNLLPPIARLLARKAVQRGDSVTVIADAVRQVATRLAADPSLGRALVAPISADSRRRPRRSPPGPGMHDPGIFAFHAS
jgi:hypothetical protein